MRTSLARGSVFAALALVVAGCAGDPGVGPLQERYEATIWVDPDGCQHWVMDDGYEGYMSPHLDREGRPVCDGGTVGPKGSIVFEPDVSAAR